MQPVTLIAVAAFALGFGLYSKRIQASDFSPTLLFTLAGLILGPALIGVLEVEESQLHPIGEWTLVMLLFADASRIDLGALRKEAGLPLRLLGIGMPLTIVLGAGVAYFMFPELGLWGAALLAAILAPTDAALGQAVVSSPVVPKRIRQALNVESGLNDGIAVPFVLFFAALASQMGDQGAAGWLAFAGQQVGVGLLAGLVAGVGGGLLIGRCDGAGTMSNSFERIAAIAVAVLAVGLAEIGGGNIFIAAFVGGLSLGNTAPRYVKCVHEFLEAEGQLLMLVVFMLVGSVIVWPALASADARTLVYAGLSLTLIRALPVSLSLLGTRARPATHVFLSWFGPRGLATVLFGLLIVSELDVPHGERIFQVAMCTVVLSIILHGITASRGAAAYGKSMSSDEGMEHEPVSDHAVRAGSKPWAG